MLATLAFVLLAVLRADATPIHPDVRQMLIAPQKPAPRFAPARAGWEGAEIQPPTSEKVPSVDILSGAATARAVRASLRAATVPNPWEIAGIVLAILLLRRLRDRQKLRTT